MAGQQHQRVLVIDDDADVRRMLIAALRRKSLLIDEASDGGEAIELLNTNHYAVVLLDLLMPNVDGFGVIDSMQESATPPILLVVSGADREILADVKSPKVHAILKKPFDAAEVADVVSACAEIRGRIDGPPPEGDRPRTVLQ